MDAGTPTHGVLVIGLDPYRVPGPWDPRPVADAIEMGIARFAEHGVDVETCIFGLDGSDDVEAVVGAALRARPWEVVVVGGGVRKPEEQLELFETVVNLVRRHAPDAAIAFNKTPADTFDAAARWLD
jgi:8-oxo-dGTP pyrophosphatase MutT (NUDIX family)